jgi:hypothetical protein
VLRLKKYSRLRLLQPPVTTSGRRWLKEGYFRTTVKNWLSLARHLAERTLTRGWPERGEVKKVSRGGGQGSQTPAPTPPPPTP